MVVYNAMSIERIEDMKNTIKLKTTRSCTSSTGTGCSRSISSVSMPG